MLRFLALLGLLLLWQACRPSDPQPQPQPLSPSQAKPAPKVLSPEVFALLDKAEYYRSDFYKDSAVFYMVKAHDLLQKEGKDSLAAEIYPKIVYEFLDGDVVPPQRDSFLSAQENWIASAKWPRYKQAYYYGRIFQAKYEDEFDTLSFLAYADSLSIALQKDSCPVLNLALQAILLEHYLEENWPKAQALFPAYQAFLLRLWKTETSHHEQRLLSFFSNLGYYLISIQGDYHKNLGDHEQDIATTLQELAYLEACPYKDSLLLETSYYSLAKTYYSRSEYDKSLEYLQKCYPLISYRHPHAAAYCYYTEGTVYAKKSLYDKAIESHQKGIAYNHLVSDGSDERWKFNLYFRNYEGISSAFLSKGDTAQAERYFDSAALYAKYTQDEYAYALARRHLRQGQIPKALAFYQSEQARQLKAYGQDYHPQLTYTYSNLAKCRLLLGDSLEALAQYQKSLRCLATNWQPKSLEDLPPLSELIRKYDALGTVLAQTRIFGRLAQANPSYLDAFARQAQFGMSVLEYLLAEVDREGDRLSFLQDGIAVYELGVQALLAQNKTEEAFVVSERSKAMLLNGSLQEHRAKAGILPDSLLALERSLKNNIQFYEANWKKELANGKAARAAVQEQYLIQYRHALDSLKQVFQQNYPKYFELRYARPQLRLNQIQAQLKDSSLWISFLQGKERLYCFQIDKQGPVRVEHHPLTKAYYRDFDSLRLALEQPRYGPSALAQYQTLAIGFVEDYLPSLKKLPSTVRYLVLCPDGQLSMLPFEALLKTPNPQAKLFGELDYWLNHYVINYQYSAFLWLQFLEQASVGRAPLLAMAASYDQGTDSAVAVNEIQRQIRKELLPIPGALEEVKWLKKHYAGQFHLATAAHEGQFKQALSQPYSVIHLAMHGVLNKKLPQNSALAFTAIGDSSQDAFLYAYEISQLPIRADLIVLSACETGYGKFQPGEGVLSLGRSFFYAGAPSLLMSLWSINDQATQQIMQAFYQGLDAGQTQAQSLHRAKLQYLQQMQVQPEAAHPAFWAALQQVGADRPLTLSRASSSLWLLLLALPLLLALWGLVRRFGRS